MKLSMKKMIAGLALAALMCSIQVAFAQEAAKSADKKAVTKKSEAKQEDLKPRFWIFMGLPGGDKEKTNYTEAVNKLYDAAAERFGVEEKDIHVLFGKGLLKEDAEEKKNQPEEDYLYKPCNRRNLKAAMSDIVKKSADGRPNVVIFIGHATAVRDSQNANFNIVGPDIKASEIGNALKHAKRTTPMGIIVATPLAERFIRPLRLRLRKTGEGRGCRSVIAACGKDEKTAWMEPEFSLLLPELFEEESSDLNGDGYLSWTEVFEGMDKRVEEFYKTENYVRAEWAALDGDGNGRATIAPARADKDGGNRFKLKIQE